jgi:hypothetical protein
LADENITVCDPILDRMTHRSALALTRAPKLKESQDHVAKQILLDLRASRALVQIKVILPLLSPQLKNAWNGIRSDLEQRFKTRDGFKDISRMLEPQISELKQMLAEGKHEHESLRFSGLIEILDQSLKEAA